jgi:hypothetical protein
MIGGLILDFLKQLRDGGRVADGHSFSPKAGGGAGRSAGIPWNFGGSHCWPLKSERVQETPYTDKSFFAPMAAFQWRASL